MSSERLLKSISDRDMEHSHPIRSCGQPSMVGCRMIAMLILICLMPLSADSASQNPSALKIEKITVGEDTIQTGRKQLIEVMVKNYGKKNIPVTVKLTITMPNQLIVTFGSKRIVAKAKTDSRALLVFPIEERKAGNYMVAARLFDRRGRLITSSGDEQNRYFFAADAKHPRPTIVKPKQNGAEATTQTAENTKETTETHSQRLQFDLPDLYIDELTISNNNSILRGETAHIKLVISNDGGDVAQDIPFSASWYYEFRPRRRTDFHNDKIDIIAPGERKVMHLPLTIPEKEQKGKYLVHAVLDKANYIKESNETNNEMTSKEFINFADIALEFPDDSHSFAEDGRFIFQWRSKEYNQFKVQISTDEEFLDMENTFELPKGQKWESGKMIQPLAGEMPALAISLMEQNNMNYLYWRVRAKNSQGDTSVSSGRKFFISLLPKSE